MIGWALETGLAMTALAAFVLLVRVPVARAFGARWAYALWLLPLLRLAMPPLDLVSPDLAAAVPVTVVLAAGPATLTQAGGASPSPSTLLSLWCVGAVLFLLWQLLGYWRFAARIEATLRPSYPAAFEGLALGESRGVDGPLAIGLLRPRIVLPYDFLTRYTPQEQALALRHERIHHRRGDLWWTLVALGLLALHWFNPLAWLAFRAFRVDQELACDAAVLADAPRETRHAYGLALVKSASRPGLLAACPLNSADQLKGRLKMLNHHRHDRLRSLAGGLVIAGTFTAGLCLSAPTIAQDAKEEPRIERREFRVMKGEDAKGELAELRKDLEGRCPESQRLETKVESGEGKQKQFTHVMLCTKGGPPPSAETREKLAQALDRARLEFQSDGKLSPEQRARAVEALRREIDRVRSEGK